MVTNGINRRVGWDAQSCTPLVAILAQVCLARKARPSLSCFRSDAGGSRLVLSGPKARYAGGLASLCYRAVTEPHLAACDKNIVRFHHYLNPVGIGRVVLSHRLCRKEREQPQHQTRLARSRRSTKHSHSMAKTTHGENGSGCFAVGRSG